MCIALCRWITDPYRITLALNRTPELGTQHAMDLMSELTAEGLITDAPFDARIDFVYFDLWHYYGRTAKHGAFMGGPDFVQWHGNYELLAKTVEMEELAAEMRAGR